MNFLKNFKIYSPFFYAAIQEKITYRLNFITWIIIEFLMTIMQLFMWNTIYNSSPNEIINDYTKYEMFLYVVIINAISRIVRVSPLSYFKNDLKTGIISTSLIKPINYRMQLFFKSISAPLINLIFLSLPYGLLLVYLYRTTEITFQGNQINVFILIISLILALIINFQLRIVLCIIIAYTTNGFGVVKIFETLDRFFSGALVPITFFPQWLFGITQILPFKYVKYTPTSIILNRIDGIYLLQAIIFQVIWVIFLEIILKKYWKKSLENISIFGG